MHSSQRTVHGDLRSQRCAGRRCIADAVAALLNSAICGAMERHIGKRPRKALCGLAHPGRVRGDIDTQPRAVRAMSSGGMRSASSSAATGPPRITLSMPLRMAMRKAVLEPATAQAQAPARPLTASRPPARRRRMRSMACARCGCKRQGGVGVDHAGRAEGGQFADAVAGHCGRAMRHGAPAGPRPPARGPSAASARCRCARPRPGLRGQRRQSSTPSRGTHIAHRAIVGQPRQHGRMLRALAGEEQREAHDAPTDARDPAGRSERVGRAAGRQAPRHEIVGNGTAPLAARRAARRRLRPGTTRAARCA